MEMKNHYGETSMNQEPENCIIWVGNDQRLFARVPVNSMELELHKEQVFKTSCQEIVYLYAMLQHKCVPGIQFH
jgi:hypothetical protein